MNFTKLLGKTLKIKDVPQNDPCFSCQPCLRLRLMELGLIKGQKIELSKHSVGLWVVKILNDNGTESSTLAMRDDELGRLLVELDTSDNNSRFHTHGSCGA
jgi:Fe2+ transport system protein FeoA